MSKNQDVARLLFEISVLLEMKGVPFKPRAYQRAALNIESLSEDIELVAAQGRLGSIPGVGEAIEEKVREYLTEGRLAYLEKLQAEIPAGLLELMRLPNVGPKTAMRLHRELKIKDAGDLKRALAEGRLEGVKGFGEKSIADLKKSLERPLAESGKRFDYLTAHEAARGLEGFLRALPGVTRAAAAGSYRRARDTVGDLDLLAETTAENAAEVMEAFVRYRRVEDVIEHGPTKSSVRLDDGLQVDLRVIPPESFATALVYFTGSKEHNIALRSLALKKGYTLNEYALTRKEDGVKARVPQEEDVYRALGLPWVPPEMRENRGEMELASKGSLPRPLELSDLRGDLHVHTTESDGAANLRSMVAAAAKRGYAYVGISDHSQGLRIANGLGIGRYRAQRKAVDALQGAFPKTRILQGSEMEILKDGSLDLPRKECAELDYVIGSVHSAFQLGRKEQTARVLAALDAGIDVLGHPTGRKVLRRASIELDLEAVAEKAAATGVLLEIDGTPDRLDLWGEAVYVCRERGAKFVVSSDAHAVGELDFVTYGVAQARRGWATSEHVVNAQPLKSLERSLGHSKR